MLGWLWTFGLASIGAWLAFMWLDDVLPTEYKEVGAKILPNPVEDGGRVTVHLEMRRNRSCPGTVHRLLRNADTGEIAVIYDPVPASVAMAIGDKKTAKTFELPEGLPPHVKYQARICFQCNALQGLFPICTDAPDILFNVIPKKG